MPDKKTIARAKKDKREGKSASTQAGEFVREEIEHVREGKHGARSTEQAIAIGLSEARRAGVDVPKKGNAARKSSRAGRSGKTVSKKSAAKKSSSKRTSAKRARASSKALKREGHSAASKKALSKHARKAARKRTSSQRSAAAKKAARTKGVKGRSAAAGKAARTRARKRK
ncbi:MAG TPA: DUF6496 domain-containing protein [Rhodanobacteraceae bacterium]|jgi:hypothetical protein